MGRGKKKSKSTRHLLRAWIREGTFTRLQNLAKEMSNQQEVNISVSDLVRAAIDTYLIIEEESAGFAIPPSFTMSDGEVVPAPFSTRG